MITRLRAAWHAVNASYWFYPALFALGALALALLTLWLDRTGFADRLGEIEALHPARPQGASNMLTVIAGSMIGVAATVFSITIAAVAYASGNYGPRLLNNFMEDRGNQLSLATFIGTFVYALTVLRAVRQEDEASLLRLNDDALPGYVPQLSLLVAYLLAGISVAVLVYFLNNIPASIRINTVLKGIGAKLLNGIDKTYPDPNTGSAQRAHPEGHPVLAGDAGYIELIDFGRLSEIASRHDGRIVMALRTGDFVHPSIPLARWCGERKEGDKLDDEIRDCFALGSARTAHQDLQFLIDELVEIGLRALSPGINDAFTAITALHWLGAATARLGERDLQVKQDRDEAIDENRVAPLNDDFAHFVARGFGAMRGSVATNRVAALVMFDTLADAAGALDDESRRASLSREGERLLAQAREHLKGPELELVEARFAGFANRFSQTSPAAARA
jgi:uncharacterized membrane protein